MATATELLPATFASEQAAREWGARINYEVVAVEPSKDSPGRYQLRISHKPKKDDDA